MGLLSRALSSLSNVGTGIASAADNAWDEAFEFARPVWDVNEEVNTPELLAGTAKSVGQGGLAMLQGLEELASAGANDVGGFFHGLVSPERAAQGFQTDDIIKEVIPSEIERIKKQYGGGLDAIAQRYVEDPASFLFDAGAVLSAPAAAKNLIKAPAKLRDATYRGLSGVTPPERVVRSKVGNEGNWDDPVRPDLIAERRKGEATERQWWDEEAGFDEEGRLVSTPPMSLFEGMQPRPYRGGLPEWLEHNVEWDPLLADQNSLAAVNHYFKRMRLAPEIPRDRFHEVLAHETSHAKRYVDPESLRGRIRALSEIHPFFTRGEEFLAELGATGSARSALSHARMPQYGRQVEAFRQAGLEELDRLKDTFRRRSPRRRSEPEPAELLNIGKRPEDFDPDDEGYYESLRDLSEPTFAESNKPGGMEPWIDPQMLPVLRRLANDSLSDTTGGLPSKFNQTDNEALFRLLAANKMPNRYEMNSVGPDGDWFGDPDDWDEYARRQAEARAIFEMEDIDDIHPDRTGALGPGYAENLDPGDWVDYIGDRYPGPVSPWGAAMNSIGPDIPDEPQIDRLIREQDERRAREERGEIEEELPTSRQRRRSSATPAIDALNDQVQEGRRRAASRKGEVVDHSRRRSERSHTIQELNGRQYKVYSDGTFEEIPLTKTKVGKGGILEPETRRDVNPSRTSERDRRGDESDEQYETRLRELDKAERLAKKKAKQPTGNRGLIDDLKAIAEGKTPETAPLRSVQEAVGSKGSSEPPPYSHVGPTSTKQELVNRANELVKQIKEQEKVVRQQHPDDAPKEQYYLDLAKAEYDYVRQRLRETGKQPETPPQTKPVAPKPEKPTTAPLKSVQEAAKSKRKPNPSLARPTKPATPLKKSPHMKSAYGDTYTDEKGNWFPGSYERYLEDHHPTARRTDIPKIKKEWKGRRVAVRVRIKRGDERHRTQMDWRFGKLTEGPDPKLVYIEDKGHVTKIIYSRITQIHDMTRQFVTPGRNPE